MKNISIKLSAFCLLSAAISCSQPQVPSQAASNHNVSDAPMEVNFAPAQGIELVREVTTTGSLAALESVTVSSEVAGRVSKLHYDIGDSVRQGVVLVELDKRELEIQVERARAALEETLARIGAPDPGHLPAVEEVSEVRQSRTLLEDAERKFNRAVELLERGVISRAQLDEVETNRDVARIRYEKAVEDVRNQLASIRSSQAGLALASKKLADAEIRAPLSGYVDRRLVSEGEYLRENTPILVLVQSHVLKLLAEVPEKEASVVRPGVEVLFTVDAFPGREFTARVTRVSPTVDQKSRSFQLEARLGNPRSQLKPGFFARCRMATGLRQAVVVPGPALHVLAGVKKIFVKSGDRVQERTVETGSEYNGSIEIVSGLKAGEEVAVTRLSDLSDGQRIQ